MSITASKPLDHGDKHLLRLIIKDRKAEGWATCSPIMWRLMRERLPVELVEFRPEGEAGSVRLTEAGELFCIYA